MKSRYSLCRSAALLAIVSGAAVLFPSRSGASFEAGRDLGTARCETLLAPVPALLELPAAPDDAVARAPVDFRSIVLRDRTLGPKIPASDDDLNRQIGEYAHAEDPSAERSAFRGLSPAPPERISEAEAKVRAFEARRRTFTEWFRSRAMTSEQEERFDEAYARLQRAYALVMSDFLVAVGIDHEFANAVTIRILPSSGSALGRMAALLEKGRSSVKLSRLVWTPKLNSSAWYHEASTTVSLSTDSLLTRKIDAAGRHELEHANQAAVTARGKPNPWQMRLLALGDAILPGPPNSDWIYGEFLSLDELRTYHGDLSHLASLLRRAILADDAAETARLAERISRSLLISTAIAQRARASLGHFRNLLDLISRTTTDEMIAMIDRGEGATSMYDEDDHTLTMQDVKNSYLFAIENFRPPLESSPEATKAARRAYARGRIDETLTVAADEEALLRFADEMLRTMAHAPTLQQQLRIAETLSAMARQRPFPSDAAYTPLTRERLLREYRTGLENPLEIWVLDRPATH